MSNRYEVWIEKGQALQGKFLPAESCSHRAYIRLAIEPPLHPANKILFFFDDKADMVTTARTLRAITEALERTLRPKYVPGEPCPECGYTCAYPDRHPHCCNCGLGQGVEGHE